jgi:NifU-like protein involved in Fe-S cluster formation
MEIAAGKTLCKLFKSIVSPHEESLPESVDQELMTFSVARNFPGRLKCASLSWDHLLDFFESRKI